MFNTDFDGVEENYFKPIPEGKYNLRIVSATEKKSSKGDDMVVVDYEIMDGPFIGEEIRFHYVVFFKNKGTKGAGMSKTFLRVIGEPYEGKVSVDPNRWVGKCLTAKVVQEPDQRGQMFPRVKFVDSYVTDYTQITKTDTGEEDPFAKE